MIISGVRIDMWSLYLSDQLCILGMVRRPFPCRDAAADRQAVSVAVPRTLFVQFGVMTLAGTACGPPEKVRVGFGAG